MSDKTVATPEIATDAPQAEETPKKPNALVRGFRKAKANPKQTLAVAGGLVLVGAAAALGRASAPTVDFNVYVTEEETPEEPQSDDTVD